LRVFGRVEELALRFPAGDAVTARLGVFLDGERRVVRFDRGGEVVEVGVAEEDLVVAEVSFGEKVGEDLDAFFGERAFAKGWFSPGCGDAVAERERACFSPAEDCEERVFGCELEGFATAKAQVEEGFDVSFVEAVGFLCLDAKILVEGELLLR